MTTTGRCAPGRREAGGEGEGLLCGYVITRARTTICTTRSIAYPTLARRRWAKMINAARIVSGENQPAVSHNDHTHPRSMRIFGVSPPPPLSVDHLYANFFFQRRPVVDNSWEPCHPQEPRGFAGNVCRITTFSISLSLPQRTPSHQFALRWRGEAGWLFGYSGLSVEPSEHLFFFFGFLFQVTLVSP